MMADTMDPVESAKRGDWKFFEEVAMDVLLIYRDEKNGDSILALAALFGQLDCCKVIYKRCPELLYVVNRNGATALHQAAGNGEDAVIKFLLRVGVETVQDIESGEQGGMINYKLLMMVNKYKHTALHFAQMKRHYHSAKLLLKADPSNNLLQMLDLTNDTVMHFAVKNHNLEFVDLVLETDPNFVYAPNKSGKTPHLIALQESLSGDTTTVAIRKLLIEKQPGECEKPIGEKGWTLLHHATFQGDTTAIEDILKFSPDCAKLVDNEGQNFIHIAAKLEHEMVVRHILLFSEVNDNVLNQQDIYGNTPLHIATSKGNANMALSMLYDPRVNKFIMNKQGKTALAAINFDYDKTRAGVYGFTEGLDEKDLKDRSEFDLLVGALISTVSFTAGITVPGGFYSDGQNMGNAILYKKRSFEAFVLSNTFALALSLYAVFCHFCTKRLTKVESIRYQLKVATYCSLGAIFAMMIAFITGSYAVLDVSNWLGISVCVICCCFFGFALRAMWGMMMEQRETRPSHNAETFCGFSF